MKDKINDGCFLLVIAFVVAFAIMLNAFGKTDER